MVEVTNLTKSFGTKKALDNLSFSIHSGSVMGLAGANGAGKSTLLRLLAGIYQPGCGTVLVNGKAPYENYNVKKDVIFLPDTPQFFYNATLYEMAQYYRGIYPAWNEQYYQHCLKAFGLEPQSKALKLSKGKLRQAAVSLALPAKPRLLLMDEVFDGLDPVMRKVLKELLIETVAANEATAILASHNLREMDGLCDSVCLLYQGKLVFLKDIDEMKQQYCRVRVVFQNERDLTEFNQNGFRRIEQQGKMAEFVTDSRAGELEQVISAKKPLLFEKFPLTLEEIVIYHLEVLGYDGKQDIL